MRKTQLFKKKIVIYLHMSLDYDRRVVVNYIELDFIERDQIQCLNNETNNQ